jgi:hypothetical protein
MVGKIGEKGMTVDEILEVDGTAPVAPPTSAPTKPSGKNIFKSHKPIERAQKVAEAEKNPLPHVPAMGISYQELMAKPSLTLGSGVTGVANFFVTGIMGTAFDALVFKVGSKFGQTAKPYFDPIRDVVRIGVGEVLFGTAIMPRIMFNIEKATKYPFTEAGAKNHARTMMWGGVGLVLIDCFFTIGKYASMIMKQIQSPNAPISTAPAQATSTAGLMGLGSLGTLIKDLKGLKVMSTDGSPESPASPETPSSPETAEVGASQSELERELQIASAKNRELTSLFEMQGLNIGASGVGMTGHAPNGSLLM